MCSFQNPGRGPSNIFTWSYTFTEMYQGKLLKSLEIVISLTSVSSSFGVAMDISAQEKIWDTFCLGLVAFFLAITLWFGNDFCAQLVCCSPLPCRNVFRNCCANFSNRDTKAKVIVRYEQPVLLHSGLDACREWGRYKVQNVLRQLKISVKYFFHWLTLRLKQSFFHQAYT